MRFSIYTVLRNRLRSSWVVDSVGLGPCCVPSPGTSVAPVGARPDLPETGGHSGGAPPVHTSGFPASRGQARPHSLPPVSQPRPWAPEPPEPSGDQGSLGKVARTAGQMGSPERQPGRSAGGRGGCVWGPGRSWPRRRGRSPSRGWRSGRCSRRGALLPGGAGGRAHRGPRRGGGRRAWRLTRRGSRRTARARQPDSTPGRAAAQSRGKESWRGARGGAGAGPGGRSRSGRSARASRSSPPPRASSPLPGPRPYPPGTAPAPPQPRPQPRPAASQALVQPRV